MVLWVKDLGFRHGATIFSCEWLVMETGCLVPCSLDSKEALLLTHFFIAGLEKAGKENEVTAASHHHSQCRHM